MPNTKRISISRTTGGNIYCIIKRLSDSYLLDPADGTFKAVVASPYSTLTEDATLKGSYLLSESRSAWTSGDYLVGLYVRLGGSPVPATDTVITYTRPVFTVRGDQICHDGFDSDYSASVVNGVVNNSNLLARTRFDALDSSNTTNSSVLGSILTKILDLSVKLARTAH